MNERILVVDDVPTNVQTVAAVLKEQGYQLSVATNGKQTLDVVKKIRPDLILLDVMMPELDGFETCQRIKDVEAWRDIPIIFLTAKTDTADLVKGFEIGAVDYVCKPFNARELLARVGTNHDATALDIFECKFNKGLAALRSKRLRKDANREKLFCKIADEVDEDGQPIDPDETLARLSRAAQSPANQEDFVYLAEMLEAVKSLPPAQRRAVELCCLQGYAPASEDPSEITAAKICGVSGTAIRTSLRKAAEKLKKQ